MTEETECLKGCYLIKRPWCSWESFTQINTDSQRLYCDYELLDQLRRRKLVLVKPSWRQKIVFNVKKSVIYFYDNYNFNVYFSKINWSRII